MNNEVVSPQRKTILVTGVGGFIGSHVAEMLLNRGHLVRGIDFLACGYGPPWRSTTMARLTEFPTFTFHQRNLAASADLSEMFRDVDVVIHLAAATGVAASWGGDFSSYACNNVTAVKHVLDAAAINRVARIVFASSSSIYGVRRQGDAPCWPSPLSPYGVTKLAGEQLCLAYSRLEPPPDIVILRYFTVYGPRQRPDMAMQRFITAVLHGDTIIVYGDGSQRRWLTYVGDAARATVGAAEAELSGVHTLDIVGPEALSVDEMVQLAAQEAGVPVPSLRRIDQRLGDPSEIYGNAATAEAILDWIPTTCVRDGVRAQIEWTASALGPHSLLGRRSAPT